MALEIMDLKRYCYYVYWFDRFDLMVSEFWNVNVLAYTDTLEMVISSGSYLKTNILI